jgi:hypothetical protein
VRSHLARRKIHLYGDIPATTNTDVVVGIPALSVTSITPTHAGPYGYLRVRGAGFSHRGLGASFNLVTVQELIVVSDSELTIILPDIGQPSGSYDLALSYGGGPGQTVHTQFTYDSTALPTPTLASSNYAYGDTAGGGQAIVLTGANLSAVTSVTILGAAVSPSATTSTTVTFTLPAHAAGVGTMTVTSPGGTSGTLPFEYWSPASAAGVTLFVERADYTVTAGTGTWVARVGGNFTSAATAPTASAGEPVFASTGRLVSAANLDALMSAATGTFACVVAPTSQDNPEQSPPYNNKAIWTKVGSGPIELWDATDGINQWYGFSAYDSLGTYIIARAVVPGLTSGRHAVVCTYQQAAWIRLSVNGSALASSSAAMPGHPLAYGTNPINIGADYSNLSTFTGSMRAFATFSGSFTDVLSAKFYAWAQQRHAIP